MYAKGIIKRTVGLITLLALYSTGCASSKSISLCYNPDLDAKDILTLKIVDAFDDSYDEVNAIFAMLQRHDQAQGDYNFCGIACYVVGETNNVPMCMVEILSDCRTVTILDSSVLSPGTIQKQDGRYIVDLTKVEEDARCCYDFPSLCEIVQEMMKVSFNAVHKDFNPVEGFN